MSRLLCFFGWHRQRVVMGQRHHDGVWWWLRTECACRKVCRSGIHIPAARIADSRGWVWRDVPA